MMRETLETFLTALIASRGLNLSKIATEQGLSFVRDIQPALNHDKEFRHRIQEYLQDLKYELIDKRLSIARQGKRGVLGDPQAMNAIIRDIDSGTILGDEMSREKEETADEVDKILGNLEEKQND